MRFLRRASGAPGRIAILAGAFNPPTVAHMALACSALEHADETVFALPRAFPHKTYAGAALEARARMLCAAAAHDPRFSVGIVDAGLFHEIAAECRAAYGPGPRLSFVCGRDAAERVLSWDYGAANVADLLRGFDLLVAARRGEIDAPLHSRHAIERLYLPDSFDAVSSTEVRERIARGLPWEHLVPEAARQLARLAYR